MAENLRANRFSIHADDWAKMTPDEQWNANKEFLDGIIANESEVLLADRVTSIEEVGGWLRRELDYLLENGYQLVDDGTRLVPGGSITPR